LKEVTVFDVDFAKVEKLMGKVSLTPWCAEMPLEILKKEMSQIRYPFALENGKKYIVNFLHDFNLDNLVCFITKV
jgi:hypothetical protein